MKTRMAFRTAQWLVALALAWISVGTISARATVHGSYSFLGDGSVKYVYLVDNVDGLFDIAGWSLDLTLDAPDWNPVDTCCGGGVEVPDPGWFAGPGISIHGDWAQDFFSWDASTDVRIGETLGEFSFVSRYRPGEVAYHAFSASGERFSGMTVGPLGAPLAVPEGRSWIVGGGLFGALVWARRMQRRRDPLHDVF